MTLAEVEGPRVEREIVMLAVREVVEEDQLLMERERLRLVVEEVAEEEDQVLIAEHLSSLFAQWEEAEVVQAAYQLPCSQWKKASTQVGAVLS